jgi:hypothetical protein
VFGAFRECSTDVHALLRENATAAAAREWRECGIISHDAERFSLLTHVRQHSASKLSLSDPTSRESELVREACRVVSPREKASCAESHGGGDDGPHQLTHATRSRVMPCRGADGALGCSGAEPMLLGTCLSRCTFITANHPPANNHLTLLLTGASPSC